MRIATAAIISSSIAMLTACGPGGVAPAPPAPAPPPVRPMFFDSRGFTEASQAAKELATLHLVHVTSAGCEECRRLESEVWTDSGVGIWLKASGIATSVDIDERPDLATALNVASGPAIILFRDGVELGRTVEIARGIDLILWVTRLDQGDRQIRSMRASIENSSSSELAQRTTRQLLVGALMNIERYDEATEEWLWLWEHPTEMDLRRGRFILSVDTRILTRLAEAHPPARKRMEELRGPIEAAIESNQATALDEMKFVVLNEALDDEKRTIAWFDRMKADPAWATRMGRLAVDLKTTLIRHDRWADYGLLLRDPLRHFGLGWTPPRAPQADPQKEIIADLSREQQRDSAADTYAALLAAKREDEATQYAAKARELDPTTAMVITLVRRALLAEEPRQAQREFLTGHTGSEIDDLRERLDRALGDANP
jgi:hypothetical protein